MSKRKGLFITLEGTEGCGKSTHAKLLKSYLQDKGHEVVLTLEPGGTGVGKSIRDILLHRDASIDKAAELLLFGADRAHHVSSVIKPALAQGKIVICDRYIDSTTAYQVGGRGLPEDAVKFINNLSSEGVCPDVTILFDVPVEVGLKRLKGGMRDRFEKESLDFHEKIRMRFLEIAKAEPDRVKIVGSHDSIDSVEEKIRKILEPYIT